VLALLKMKTAVACCVRSERVDLCMAAFHKMYGNDGDDDDCAIMRQTSSDLASGGAVLNRAVFDAWAERLDERRVRLFKSRPDLLLCAITYGNFWHAATSVRVLSRGGTVPCGTP
jgi:hypothetical protein